jgi:hypothetical protein
MEGAKSSSHAVKTTQRYLRRLLLNRIMNCWMANLCLCDAFGLAFRSVSVPQHAVG